MKKIKLISLFSAALFCIVGIFPLMTLGASAAKADSPPACRGVEAYCFYDLTHGRMLASHNAEAVIKTSTSAKVTSGLIFCEELSERLDETVTVTEDMISGVSGHSMHLSVGEKVTVRDLLYAAICGSYNDAAYVLAHVVSGDVESFVAHMNRRAVELGATSTVYTNPIGFPENDAMVTTAADTLNIAKAAASDPLYREFCSAIKYSMPATNTSEARQIYNKNALIATTSYGTNYHLSSASGMNAGYSGEGGGWSVVAVAEDDGAELICVALGGKESEDGYEIYAYEAVHTLVKWASQAFERVSVFGEGQQVTSINVSLTGIAASQASCVTVEAIDVYVPVGERELYYEPILNEKSLRAPVKAGDEVGRVIIVCNGETVGEGKLVLGESYEANAIMLGIEKLGEYTKSRAFAATVICFVVLTVGALIVYRFKPVKIKRRGR